MSDEIQYGFSEEIIGDRAVCVIMTGDGLTQFHDVTYPDDSGVFGLAISYGHGDGTINKLVVHDEPLSIESFNVGFLIKFRKTDSIDAMISQLQHVKSIMVNSNLIDGNKSEVGDE